MEFHLDGFLPGDPDNHSRSRTLRDEGVIGTLPEMVDVLIVGCGPAGLTLAAQLAKFPDVNTCIIEQKDGQLLRGQADGIACRTMEMFQAFGLAHKVLREACWINETVFWSPDPLAPDQIVRSGRVQDTEDGLSEFPHVVLNQARIHDFYLELMSRSACELKPYYKRRFLGLQISADPAESYPALVRVERTDPCGMRTIETVRARYVVGCDGARSSVRKSIGRILRGDSANHAWGVMDLLAATSFPDIRFKTLIRSAAHGSMIVIPREGGHLFRLYIELGKLGESERAADRNVTVDQLVQSAQQILSPYSLDVKEVPWWSVYEIGQRLADHFDNADPDDPESRPCVFIAGDACHTHSPKAGQGMNVSMQDAFNLGWKLASVLRGQSRPSLLRTYSAERRAIAEELIEFDREWASVLSSSKGSPREGQAVTQQYFVQHGHYTAGVATRYRQSMLTNDDRFQNLALGFTIGTRFHSSIVLRVSDAKPMQLGHCVEVDGRWRLFIFAGHADDGNPAGPVGKLCEFLENDPRSPVLRALRPGADLDSVIDVRCILQIPHCEIDLNSTTDLLRPTKGRLGLRSYDKLFSDRVRGAPSIYDTRHINREAGCMILVRPDQHISDVLPLTATERLSAFFKCFTFNVARG